MCHLTNTQRVAIDKFVKMRPNTFNKHHRSNRVILVEIDKIQHDKAIILAKFQRQMNQLKTLNQR